MATVTGALFRGDQIFNNAVVGAHDGKLFTVAFTSLVPGDFRISGFRSEDDGETWEAVGSEILARGSELSQCIDGRGDSHPYIHIAFPDPSNRWSTARFNMAAATFDLEAHGDVAVAPSTAAAKIASRSDGALIIGRVEGPVTENLDHSFTHLITPYTVSVDPDTHSYGGPQPVPGIDAPNGQYGFFGILAGPAAGGHPEGDLGFFYVLSELYWNGADYSFRTVWFDDTGARTVFDDGAVAFRGATRSRGGAPEPIGLTYAPGFVPIYRAESISNDDGGSLICDQSEIPPASIEGGDTAGGGAIAANGGTAYLLWFDGSELKTIKASDALTDCSSWQSTETLLSVLDSPAVIHGASFSGGALNVLYGVSFVGDPSDDWIDVRFVRYPFALDQILTGLAGITSEEAFGKTFGVIGTQDQCGDISTDPIDDGCDGPTLGGGGGDDGHCEEIHGGYAF